LKCFHVPLLRLLQATTSIAEEFVFLTQHLASRELSKASRDGRVLLDVDGKIEEGFVSGRGLNGESNIVGLRLTRVFGLYGVAHSPSRMSSILSRW
jgi:hypothetical protein